MLTGYSDLAVAPAQKQVYAITAGSGRIGVLGYSASLSVVNSYTPANLGVGGTGCRRHGPQPPQVQQQHDHGEHANEHKQDGVATRAHAQTAEREKLQREADERAERLREPTPRELAQAKADKEERAAAHRAHAQKILAARSRNNG